jgi:hypothetical protein
MGKNAKVAIDFDDGRDNVTITMNNNTLSLEKAFTKSGNYTILAGVLVNNQMITSSTAVVTMLPTVVFKLKCDAYVQVGDLLNCLIIDVTSNANVNILVDFGDGEERLLYLANSDIPLQKVYAEEANFTIIVESIDKYLNKTRDNQTVQVVGGIFKFAFL